MDVIYDWLLHNTGNEGNYLTILNTQPFREGEEMTELMVMARTKNFDILNLSIKSSPSSKEAWSTESRTVEKEYHFGDADQVIAYLSDDQQPDSLVSAQEYSLYVYVFKPSDESDEITFPPQR